MRRMVIAVLFVLLWIGWSVWDHIPHYYDSNALAKEMASIVGTGSVKLEPAQAGFPFLYMRYDYSNAGQLTVWSWQPDAFFPNALFTLIGTLGVVVLVLRTRRITLAGGLIAVGFIAPAVALYTVLNGWHHSVIAYVYMLPAGLLMTSLTAELLLGQSLDGDSSVDENTSQPTKDRPPMVIR
ncbi:hypothetical protein [Pirellula sp. SH-Sr6A]|uniref:hypothetical protein n=1 Tax=Pirellula sp. SH-Sr6A TaxID=1632865 RepID=UPI00197B28D4|nr:hypothetical protein [Pirellula sp. SH-Sr6A]